MIKYLHKMYILYNKFRLTYFRIYLKHTSFEYNVYRGNFRNIKQIE